MGFWNEGRQENVNKLAFGVLGLLWRFSSGLAAYQQVCPTCAFDSGYEFVWLASIHHVGT
jgi:hypothetical protein